MASKWENGDARDIMCECTCVREQTYKCVGTGVGMLKHSYAHEVVGGTMAKKHNENKCCGMKYQVCYILWM